MKYLLMLVSILFPCHSSYVLILKKIVDVDYDPRKAARDERKERVAKNLKKQQQNIARAATTSREERKSEIEKTLASARISTASMGKFDRRLEGEKKVRGVKRKVLNFGKKSMISDQSLIPFFLFF